MLPKEYTKSLRLIARFLDNVPENFPIPDDTTLSHSFWSIDKASQAAEAIRITQELGNCKKEYSENALYLKREFGQLTLSYILSREAVCTRKVTGTRFVEAISYPAHHEDIVEWICNPLLSATKEVK